MDICLDAQVRYAELELRFLRESSSAPVVHFAPAEGGSGVGDSKAARAGAASTTFGGSE